MRIIEEHFIESFSDLEDLCWSGARDTLEDIRQADLEDEFMEHLEMIFSEDEDITNTTINDYIWFERDEIYKQLGLDENGQVIDDDEV